MKESEKGGSMISWLREGKEHDNDTDSVTLCLLAKIEGDCPVAVLVVGTLS